MANRIAGTAYLSINGQTYMLAGNFEYSVCTVTRETLVGQDGVHGYKEMPFAGHIAGTIRDSADVPMATFNGMTGVNAVIELANGKTVIGSNLWSVETQDVKTEDGTFELRLEGFSVSD